MISVVLPAYNKISVTKECLESIENCTWKPDEILVIDNGSSDDYTSLISSFSWKINVILFRNKENMGVNYAWNQGISNCKTKYLTFLNNDTILNPLFFKKIFFTMEKYKDVGICTPELARSDAQLKEYKDEDVILEDEPYIEGWAFTIRKDILNVCGQIPPQLKTFMGDTFLFWWTEYLGYSIKKMVNNKIHHTGSLTVRDIPDYIKLQKAENEEWRKMKSDLTKKGESNARHIVR